MDIVLLMEDCLMWECERILSQETYLKFMDNVFHMCTKSNFAKQQSEVSPLFLPFKKPINNKIDFGKIGRKG